jgi:hypothetical protein
LTLQDFTTTSRTTATFPLSIPTASPTCCSHNSDVLCAIRLPPTADFTTIQHSHRCWLSAFVTLLSPSFAPPSCISRHPPPLPRAAPAMMALCLRHPCRQVLHSQVASLDTHHRSHTHGSNGDGSLPSSPSSPRFACFSKLHLSTPTAAPTRAAPTIMALRLRHHRRQVLHPQVAPLGIHHGSHTRGPSDDGPLPSSPLSPSFAFPSCISRHPPPLSHTRPQR